MQNRPFLAALRGALHCNAGESKRPKNWTQYIREIKEDVTICAFPRDVWNALTAETATDPRMFWLFPLDYTMKQLSLLDVFLSWTKVANVVDLCPK